MVLRILHPILASTLCAANPLARIAEPTIEMLMGNLVSASTGQLWTEIASCAPRQRAGAIDHLARQNDPPPANHRPEGEAKNVVPAENLAKLNGCRERRRFVHVSG